MRKRTLKLACNYREIMVYVVLLLRKDEAGT